VLREDTETNDATALPQPGLQQPQPELPQAEPGLLQAHPGPPPGQPGLPQARPGLRQPQPGLRQPQPGLRQLNELLDEARDASGAGLRLIVSGPPAELDPGVELAAYRIVQEALTNSRRHAPGAAVDVELRYADDALRMRIRDNGPGPPIAPPAGSAVNGATNSGYSGHGLLGMRERAAAVGGELRTGPASGGGFLIEARLPAKLEEAR
jgi:nitrate/nitrite-specific signal transduction histidine kinase